MQLYINNIRAEVDDNTTISFNYQIKDTTSPDAVKNSFSKTVSLPLTSINHRIFDHASEPSRINNDRFRTNTRTPFTLADDSGNIMESGYLKLDSVTDTYNVTLYGTLGDFFYNLSTDEETGEEKTLADLYYGFVVNGEQLTPEEETKHRILCNWNKDYINKSWNELSAKTSVHSLEYNLTCAPAYNGELDDFDNDKILITNETDETSAFFPEISGYSKQKGYSLITTPRNVDEYEIRDLRSNMQRPAIKLSKVIEACCNPENNGGYEVVLDGEITNEASPQSAYYNKSYLMLGRLDFEEDEAVNDITSLVAPTLVIDKGNMTASGYVTDSYGNEEFDMSIYDNPTIKLEIQPVASGEGAGGVPKVMYCMGYTSNFYPTVDGRAGVMIGGLAYKVVTEKDGIVDSETDWKVFLNGDKTYTLSSLKLYVPDYHAQLASQLNVDTDKVHFVEGILWNTMNYQKQQQGEFEASITLPFTLNAPRASGVKYKVICKVVQCSNLVDKRLKILTTNWWSMKANVAEEDYSISAYTVSNGSQLYNGEVSPVLQKTGVNKAILFNNSPTPFDILASFCKLLDLRFDTDKANKKIYIKTRNNFYINKINDINDKIDRNRTTTLIPSLVDSKWYSYKLETPDDTYANKLYRKKCKINYGEYKLNTNYEFNNNTHELFEDNSFKNLIPYRLKSVYFNDIASSNETINPAVYTQTFDYTLFKTNSSGGVDTETVTTSGMVASKKVAMAYDSTKLCAFDSDSSYVDDSSYAITFFDGWYSGNTYTLSDNLLIMNELNGKPCFLQSMTADTGYDSLSATTTKQICIHRDSIPVFSKYSSDGEGYVASWDFSKPEMTFIGDAAQYTNDCTLYHYFWENYITDLYDDNSKSVEVYYKLENPSAALHEFYFFDNQLWYLNKITDYTPDDDVYCKCVFVKVKDIRNYIGYDDDLVNLSSVNKNGYATSTGNYRAGTTVTTRAIPNVGYRFVEWSDGDTNPAKTLTLYEDEVVQPIFEEGELKYITADPDTFNRKYIDSTTLSSHITYSGDDWDDITITTDSDWILL